MRGYYLEYSLNSLNLKTSLKRIKKQKQGWDTFNMWDTLDKKWDRWDTKKGQLSGTLKKDVKKFVY